LQMRELNNPRLGVRPSVRRQLKPSQGARQAGLPKPMSIARHGMQQRGSHDRQGTRLIAVGMTGKRLALKSLTSIGDKTLQGETYSDGRFFNGPDASLVAGVQDSDARPRHPLNVQGWEEEVGVMEA